MASDKAPQTDRSHGGPGSSHQDPSQPQSPREAKPDPGEPTNKKRSRVSGGGGEQDRHHTHDPRGK
ncbi:MAG: hypothetical protein ACM3Q1_07565 [Bacteroidales bacterium]